MIKILTASSSALLLFALVGCASFSNIVKDDFVKTQAAADLQCSAEEINVTRSSNTNRLAEGCGKLQNYVCWTSPGLGDGVCQKN